MVNKTRATFSTNENPNQNQSCFGRTRLLALGASYMYLLRILIGSLCCLHLLRLARVITLVLVLRHSTGNRSVLLLFKCMISGPLVWDTFKGTRTSVPDKHTYNLCISDLYKNEISIKEVVKTTILEQDPPNHKIDGGLCQHPSSLPQPQKMVFLLHSHPSIQQRYTTMGFNPHFSCLSNADSC